MVSKIIEKEKERQEKLLSGCRNSMESGYNVETCGELYNRKQEICNSCYSNRMFHKQSLINLKEYLEKIYDDIGDNWRADSFYRIYKYVEEDIRELKKMIEKYS